MGEPMGLWMTGTQKGAPYEERALVKRGSIAERLVVNAKVNVVNAAKSD